VSGGGATITGGSLDSDTDTGKQFVTFKILYGSSYSGVEISRGLLLILQIIIATIMGVYTTTLPQMVHLPLTSD